MQLRPATVDDLDLLRHWDAQPHVRAAHGSDDWYDWPIELATVEPWRELLIAEEAGLPVGVLEIIDPAREPTRYWGEVEGNLRALDIWIGEARDLGRGLGSEMMRLALSRCFATATVQAVLVDPLVGNERAHRFYERLGFRRVARQRFEREDCYVYRLDRVIWERSLRPSGRLPSGP